MEWLADLSVFTVLNKNEIDTLFYMMCAYNTARTGITMGQLIVAYEDPTIFSLFSFYCKTSTVVYFIGVILDALSL